MLSPLFKLDIDHIQGMGLNVAPAPPGSKCIAATGLPGTKHTWQNRRKDPSCLEEITSEPDKELFVCSLAHGYSLCISASLQNQSKADMSQDSMLYFEPYLCSPYLVTFRSADGNA